MRVLRHTAAKIVKEKVENERLLAALKVLKTREQRIKCEAEERERQLQKFERINAVKREERAWVQAIKKENEDRIKAVQKHVQDEKNKAKAGLLKPAPTKGTAALSKFRRMGAVTVAANARSFGTAFAAIESGKLGESIIKDMKVHRIEKSEQRLRGEVQKSKNVAE